MIRWVLMGIGLVAVVALGAAIVLGIVVFLDEWIQPWDKRGKG